MDIERYTLLKRVAELENSIRTILARIEAITSKAEKVPDLLAPPELFIVKPAVEDDGTLRILTEPVKKRRGRPPKVKNGH